MIGPYLEEVITILTSFPGNLTYHLIVSFSIGGALFMAYQNWQATSFPQARRMVFGLAALLVVRFSFFFTSLLLFTDPSTSDLILPLFDRTVNALSLVIIVWLWAFPEPSRRADTAMAILACLILLMLGISLVNWSGASSIASNSEADLFFNQSVELNSAWEILSIGLSLLGILLLVIRRPNGWGIGLMMCTILGIGDLGHLLFPAPVGHYAGSVRLAQLAAYPMLLALPGRFASSRKNQVEPQTPSLTVERRSYAAEFETFKAFTALAIETDPDNLYSAYTRMVSHLMLADICLLVTLKDREISFECGYDLIREQAFPGAAFNTQSLPLLAAALDRNKTLRLPASSTSPDLKTLSESLETNRIGHLLAAPIPFPIEHPITGLVLLSPYSNRAWNTNDERYLVDVAASLAAIYQHNRQIADRERKYQEIESELADATDMLPEQTFDEFATVDFDNRYAGFSASTLHPAAFAALLSEQENSRETIDHLQQEVDVLRGQLENRPTGTDESALIDEIRQPAHSIHEYVDVLLSGKAGELTEEERRYLQRIRASVERIESSLSGGLDVESQYSNGTFPKIPVSLYELIDEAIDFTRPNLTEKNIALRVDLPDQLPELGIDREALQQVLIFLLQNAGAATPSNGEIALYARHANDQNPGKDVLVQVMDEGGGISVEDLPNIFSRLSYTGGSGISGVGDKGIGLALAKQLVETQHGRIWVESQLGVGSTFNVLLPTFDPGANGESERKSEE